MFSPPSVPLFRHPPINSAPSPLCRLSVSESSEWVCTKTIFANGSVVRGCEKTYTGKSVRYRINKQRLVVVVSGDLGVVWTRLQTREWTQPLASLLVVVVHQDYWRLRICLLSIIYNWQQDGNPICLYLQNIFMNRYIPIHARVQEVPCPKVVCK